MTMAPSKLDRADWNRFAKTNKNRCIVCGQQAQVTVNMTSTELPGENGAGKTGRLLVKQSFAFCHEHGIMRFGNGLRALNG